MSPARLILAVALGALAATIPGSTFAADPDPYIDENPLGSTSIYVGCTLGEDWDGFPTHLMPDFENTGATEKLDITLPLYVTWILDFSEDTVAQPVDPPQPITDFAWFDGFHDDFEVVTADVQNNVLYNQCAEGDDLEAPALSSYPLNASGELHVEDVHGGLGTTTLIRLRRYTNPQHTQGVLLHLGWSSPATRVNPLTEDDENYSPSEVWTRAVHALISPTTYVAYYDNKIVEWTSSDFGSASPRAVDAADLSAFSAAYGSGGSAVRWGFESDESPTNSPTFQADLTCVAGSQHNLDASDVSHFAADFDKSCGLSKSGPGEDVVTVMAWFGFTRTGQTIIIGANGETAPEYVLSDPEQGEIGRRDPYGYRTRVNAVQTVPWSVAKRLYR